ncbi:GNAT family N-acetyltransferase [Bartonella sp. LJL80]
MIRKAVSSDLQDVLRLCREFHTASGVPFPFSETMAKAIFQACLTNTDLVCLLMENETGVQGILAAQCGLHRFSPVKIAEEIIWWVSSEHRGMSSIKMLERYEEWAKAKGCAFASMIGLGDDPITTALYRRKGYQAQEKHFLKRL